MASLKQQPPFLVQETDDSVTLCVQVGNVSTPTIKTIRDVGLNLNFESSGTRYELQLAFPHAVTDPKLLLTTQDLKMTLKKAEPGAWGLNPDKVLWHPPPRRERKPKPSEATSQNNNNINIFNGGAALSAQQQQQQQQQQQVSNETTSNGRRRNNRGKDRVKQNGEGGEHLANGNEGSAAAAAAASTMANNNNNNVAADAVANGDSGDQTDGAGKRPQRYRGRKAQEEQQQPQSEVQQQQQPSPVQQRPPKGKKNSQEQDPQQQQQSPAQQQQQQQQQDRQKPPRQQQSPVQPQIQPKQQQQQSPAQPQQKPPRQQQSPVQPQIQQQQQQQQQQSPSQPQIQPAAPKNPKQRREPRTPPSSQASTPMVMTNEQAAAMMNDTVPVAEDSTANQTKSRYRSPKKVNRPEPPPSNDDDDDDSMPAPPAALMVNQTQETAPVEPTPTPAAAATTTTIIDTIASMAISEATEVNEEQKKKKKKKKKKNKNKNANSGEEEEEGETEEKQVSETSNDEQQQQQQQQKASIDGPKIEIDVPSSSAATAVVVDVPSTPVFLKVESVASPPDPREELSKFLEQCQQEYDAAIAEQVSAEEELESARISLHFAEMASVDAASRVEAARDSLEFAKVKMQALEHPEMFLPDEDLSEKHVYRADLVSPGILKAPNSPRKFPDAHVRFDGAFTEETASQVSSANSSPKLKPVSDKTSLHKRFPADIEEIRQDLAGLKGDGCMLLTAKIELSSPLKNLSLVSLSGNDIGDDSLGILCAALIFSACPLKSLDMSDNCLSPVGAASIYSLLKSCEDLAIINLSHNNLGASGVKAIYGKPVTWLKKLYLNSNNICDEGAAHLGKSLANKNCQLTHLDVGNNALKSLRWLKDATTLEEINLSDNPLGDGNLQFMQKIVTKSSLKTILMRGVSLTDKGIVPFAQTVSKQPSTLSVLDIASNFDCTREALNTAKELIEKSGAIVRI